MQSPGAARTWTHTSTMTSRPVTTRPRTRSPYQESPFDGRVDMPWTFPPRWRTSLPVVQRGVGLPRGVGRRPRRALRHHRSRQVRMAGDAACPRRCSSSSSPSTPTSGPSSRWSAWACRRPSSTPRWARRCRCGCPRCGTPYDETDSSFIMVHGGPRRRRVPLRHARRRGRARGGPVADGRAGQAARAPTGARICLGWAGTR